MKCLRIPHEHFTEARLQMLLDDRTEVGTVVGDQLVRRWANH
jgi:hypothetical protein